MRKYSDEIEFISVIIPSFNRFHYLEELINSIHKYADAPFELIVHDDGSTDGTSDRLLHLRDRISTIILNNGLNLGLAESINRMVKIAGSNYILMLNADCRIEEPIFKYSIDALKCKFVGISTFLDRYGDIPNTFVNNGTMFYICRGIGSGCISAFRKDVWEIVGGWNNYSITSGNADVSFASRILKNGYFIVSPVRLDLKILVSNLSMDRTRGSDSTIGKVLCNRQRTYDCSFPKIFNGGPSEESSIKRYETSNNLMQSEYPIPEGEVNIHYWHTYCEEMVDMEYNINWDVAKRHGQYRWKEEVQKYLKKLR
jgi:glycosyltransferase involved in cell wall biosynthesis